MLPLDIHQEVYYPTGSLECGEVRRPGADVVYYPTGSLEFRSSVNLKIFNVYYPTGSLECNLQYV